MRMRRKDREVTEMEEIQQIFDECKVCRIGIMDENGPYIVPVNYGYVREEGKVILSMVQEKEKRSIWSEKMQMSELKLITDMNWWKEIPHVSTVITMQVSSEKELQVLSIIQEKS